MCMLARLEIPREGADVTNTFQNKQQIGCAGIPIIPDEKVVGLVTADLKDIPLETALDIVLAGCPPE